MRILQVGRAKDFEILDVATPEPGEGEVLLRIDGVTTCPQWDLHLRHNEPMFVGHKFHYPYTPGQPGHEATGVIEAVGSNVGGVSVGDRVSAWRDAGQDVPGCYAQYVVHKAENVIRVPEDLPAQAVASVELAMCVGVSFLMLNEMDAVRGRRFGVMGLGPAGLVAAQMARAEGAAEVIGFDPEPARRDAARALGFDACDPAGEAAGRFPARPASPVIDCGIDCVGAKASVEFLMDRTRDAVALFGVQREDYVFAPRHYGGLRLCGYRGHSRAAAEYAVRMIERRELRLAPLVTHTMSLDGYAEAVDLLETRRAIKVMFTPWS